MREGRKEGDEGGRENWRKAKEGGGGRAFPPSRILYPQSGFHPPSHQQPRLRNPSANSTHRNTHRHTLIMPKSIL